MRDKKEKKGLNVSVRSFLTAMAVLLVLGSAGGGTLIAVIVFLLVVGGFFNALEKGGLMQYMLSRIVSRFGGAKYRLQAVIVLFFMSMGAFLGSFEECVLLRVYTCPSEHDHGHRGGDFPGGGHCGSPGSGYGVKRAWKSVHQRPSEHFPGGCHDFDGGFHQVHHGGGT
ncbi:MAG: hypothetical protein IKJ99_05905 [Oscillospiraceae bacterium]|nr:hypothetical protein [Oscillospiraceae bacterium]